MKLVMKLVKCVSIFVMLVCSFDATATEFEIFTNLWYQARFPEIRAVASNRLAVNTNDLIGVLIKASLDFEFCEPSVISNSLERVLAVGRECRHPSFVREFQITQLDIRCALDDFSTESEAEKEEDQSKAGLPGKLPHFYEEIKALDDDGVFSGVISNGVMRGSP